MCENHNIADELPELLAALREDLITDAQADRLAALLRDDPAARRTYIRYMAITAELHGGRADGTAECDQLASAGDASAAAPCVPVETATGFPSTFAPLGGFMFSYAAAIVILATAMLIGWACQLSPPSSAQFDSQQAAIPADPEVTPGVAQHFVGQITGMVDCRWANPRTAPVGLERIAPGRRYALLSGLMEITYKTGARVILQGPCDYCVRSEAAGYLSAGRLAAKVARKTAVGRQSPNLQISKSPNPPLFSVETPMVTIADLGTEFGVEVAKSGACKTHVYQGKVELRVPGSGGSAAKTVLLTEHESARVEPDKEQVVAMVRDIGYQPRFVREMPRRLRITLFNTGVNLGEGRSDPHWQAVARSDDTNFKPRPAVVSGLKWNWLCNQADRSQWISFAADPQMPAKPVYTFRTSFDLSGVRPSTAILHGRFVVDNHVRAIRINGHDVAIPKHGREDFGFFHPFTVDHGFVDGVNVLEMDVENTVEPGADAWDSPMGLLVELDGSALAAWPDRPRGANDSETKD